MSLFDSLANLLGDAMTDVRRSVVEEGWFGRPVTSPEGFDGMVKDLYGEPLQGPELDPDRPVTPEIER
jgi:hypothetical protein